MNNLLHGAVAKALPSLIGTKCKQRLTILTYHGVMSEHDYMRPWEPTVAALDWQMQLLFKYFSPLSLSEALSMIATRSLPERAVCVTFDDGYANNFELALPVLKRWRIPATVYVATDFLNGGRMWNDSVIEAFRIGEGPDFDLREIGLDIYDINGFEKRRVAAESVIREIKHWPPEKRAHAVKVIESRVGVLPDNLMMTDDQVRQLSAEGVEVGAHTKSHPILATLDSGQSKDEIIGSKAYLENLLRKPVRHFAYPNGRPGIDYTFEHRDFVESAGFESAVSTQWGAASRLSDKWQLPRFTPWDRTSLHFMARLLLNYRNPA